MRGRLSTLPKLTSCLAVDWSAVIHFVAPEGDANSTLAVPDEWMLGTRLVNL